VESKKKDLMVDASDFNLTLDNSALCWLTLKCAEVHIRSEMRCMTRTRCPVGDLMLVEIRSPVLPRLNMNLSGKPRSTLYKYITGITQTHKHKLITINGIPDHVHLLWYAT
jgi:Transposase IS200 like